MADRRKDIRSRKEKNRKAGMVRCFWAILFLSVIVLTGVWSSRVYAEAGNAEAAAQEGVMPALGGAVLDIAVNGGGADGAGTNDAGTGHWSKYVCNALVALIAAMLVNFVAVILTSQMHKTTDSEILEHTLSYFENNDPDAKYVSSTETPRSHDMTAVFKVLASNPFERWK